MSVYLYFVDTWRRGLRICKRLLVKGVRFQAFTYCLLLTSNMYVSEDCHAFDLSDDGTGLGCPRC